MTAATAANGTSLSQRAAAKLGAAAFLISFPALVFANFGLRGPLLETTDAAEIIQFVSETGVLFGLSIALDLVYCIGLIVLLSALYVVLSPIGRYLASLAAIAKLVYAMTAVLIAVGLLTTLDYATDPAYVEALGARPLRALVQVNVGLGFDLYYVGLVFWALSSTLFSWLWFRSGYIPAALSAFGLVSSAWCLFCAVAYIAVPDFATVINVWLFDTPMVLFYIALSVWLLFRGLRAEEGRGR